MIVQSHRNSDYYQDNKPYSFKIKLRQTLELQGDWKVALTEITLKESSKQEDTLCIYSNICGESIINGVNVALLRRIVVNNNTHTLFTSPYYIPVVKSELSEIEFKLENDQGELAKHIKNPVTLVVHLTSARVNTI